MNSSLHKMLLLFVLTLTIFLYGCSTINIVDLKQQPLTSSSLNHLPSEIVGIETLEVDSDYTDANKWQQGLADALRNEGIFKTVSQSFVKKDNFDLLIRGKMSGKFRHHGTKNFFTWWLGPLIYAQGWRGTRFIYDAHSDIELIDASSGNILGKYHAESSYELSHRSYNPWHLFGTLFMFPGIIKASFAVAPRAHYRQKIYETVYPNLWGKMTRLINEDQSKIYSQRIASLQDKCGKQLDEELEIGMIWSEYVSCQTRRFRFLGQETTEPGTVSVYLSNDRSLRIHVANDGRIIRWYIPNKH